MNCQKISGLLPSHDTYIELLLGESDPLISNKSGIKQFVVSLNQRYLDQVNVGQAEKVNQNCIEFIRSFDFTESGISLIFINLTNIDQDYKAHLSELIDLVTALPRTCHVIILGDTQESYAQSLKNWSIIDLAALNCTHHLWYNFDLMDANFYGHVGDSFTDRQRIKRKVDRWTEKFRGLPDQEQKLILASLLDSLTKKKP
ncbi:hypothetical protein [Acinetobacter sp. P1(2025)]|uniref:hypothetical protein n=1 Tax=Acinetobacter sp. P1(2025) TaxID=3446120 RepID=UPI003F52AC34